MRRYLCAAILIVPALAGAQEAGPPQQVHPPESVAGTPIAVATAADGRFVVAWRDSSSFPDSVMARRFDASGTPAGPAFTVGLTNQFIFPAEGTSVASDAAGNFTVVWSSKGPALPFPALDIAGRRFAADGTPLGAEFILNTTTTGNQVEPAIAMGPAGGSLVVWTSPDSSGSGVYGRAVSAAGAPLGAEFRVATATAGATLAPAAAVNALGQSMVVWQSRGQDGSAEGIYARRFDGTGAPLGAEQRVNTFTTGIQAFPVVAAVEDNGFVVAWASVDGRDDSGPGVFARHYDAAGNAPQPEVRVGRTPALLNTNEYSVVRDGHGGFAIAWASGFPEIAVRRYDAASLPLDGGLGANSLPNLLTPNHFPDLGSDGAGRLTLAWTLGNSLADHATRRYGAAWPGVLRVDAQAGGQSDGNGVLDPGEAVTVAPTWLNRGPAIADLAGTIFSFTGPGAPANPAYLVVDAQAAYGAVPADGSVTCSSAAACYTLGVSATNPRPQQHIDATFKEQLAAVPGEAATRTWVLHVGGSFADVARSSPFYRFAETLLHFGISGGCTATSFCPDTSTTREQMAAFLLTAKLGALYQPPRPAQGVFTDVPASGPFAPWVEDFWNREIVEGCGPGLYCPTLPVTRAQMAVMLLRSFEGTAYTPPACTTPVFTDVPCSDPFARWVNELAARGITAGCGGGLYCPSGAVTRAQMAVFITRTFALDIDAPATLADPRQP